MSINEAILILSNMIGEVNKDQEEAITLAVQALYKVLSL